MHCSIQSCCNCSLSSRVLEICIFIIHLAYHKIIRPRIAYIYQWIICSEKRSVAARLGNFLYDIIKGKANFQHLNQSIYYCVKLTAICMYNRSIFYDFMKEVVIIGRPLIFRSNAILPLTL